MAVIGAHRDHGIGAALGAATRLFLKQHGDQRHHVDTAVEMVVLEESTRRFDRHIAKMGEMDAFGKGPRNLDHVIVRPRTERTGAERDSVCQ